MSWLSWWKKDEKKDNQEEESKRKKKVNIIGEGNVIDNNWFTDVVRSNKDFTITIKSSVYPCYVETRSTTNGNYMMVPLTEQQIGSIPSNPNNRIYGTCTYFFPRLLVSNGGFNFTNGVSCAGVYIKNISDTLNPEVKTWYECTGDLQIKIKRMYTKLSTELLPLTPLTLSENEEKIPIPGKINLYAKYNSTYHLTYSREENLQINYITDADRDTGLIISGIIPLWVYNKMLPLKTKGRIDSDGTLGGIYHIGSINDTFYQNVENSIDFGTRDDIDLSYFENFYIKYVTILYTYQEEIEEKHTFQYWEDGVLKDSVIKYVGTERKDIASVGKTSSSVGYVLTIHFNPQTENDFLDKYITEESGNKILVFDMSLTDLDEEVRSLTDYSFGGNLIVIDQMIRKESGNVFTIECCSEQIKGIHVICSSGTIKCTAYPNYKITNLYCINTDDLNLENKLPEIELTLSTQDYIKLTYDSLYLTNVKGSATYPVTNVNLVVSGDITSCYTTLPSGVNTINAPPAPGEYLEGESSMDLSNVKELDLTNFGDLDENGKFFTQEAYSFTSQEIFPSKITVISGNGDKVETSEMRSSNKKEDSNEYALTVISTVVLMDDSIPTAIQTSSDDSTLDDNTIRIQLYGDDDVKGSDCMQDYVDGKTLNIKLSESLSEKFDASKSNLELYIVTIGMNTFSGDEESNKIEFFSDDVTEVSVHYGEGGNTIKIYGTESTSFTTHLGTLNITYTESESDSSIQPITYSSNGTVKAIGLQTKESGITLIDTVNSINTIVTGSITQNRITLVNDGCIPKKMYTDILPIGETEEHYVDLFGNITDINVEVARLVAINEPPENKYLTYKSSMNLIDVKNVDISKFGTVKESESDPNLYVLDKQNVFLSSILVYDNEVNKKVGKAGLMSRNEVSHGRTLGDGETPNYLPTNVVYQRDDIVDNIVDNYKLFIREQNCNNFLKSVTETESGTGTETVYTDIYLNQECSSSFQENSENTLKVSILYLLNQYLITFNGKEGGMGNLRIHYLKSNPEEGDTVDEFGYVVYVPSNPKYEVDNLYIASGEYEENTSNLIPHPIEWSDQNGDHKVFNRTEENGVTTSITLDLKYKEKLTYVVSVVNTPYCINTLVSNQDYHCNLIVSGEIPQWVFKDLLPLPRSIGDGNVITGNDTVRCLLDINRSLEGYVGISLNSSTECMIDLTNVADPEIFNRTYLYGEKTTDDNKVFFVNKVKVLKRFEGKIDVDGNDALFQYYDGMTRNASTVELDEYD